MISRMGARIGTLLFASLAAVSCAGSLQRLPERIAAGDVKVVDLSHTLAESSPFWPGGLPFRKELLVDYKKGYRMHKFTLAENVGTHMDAPAHFVQGRHTISDIPAEDLIAPLVVVDIRLTAETHPDAVVTVGDLTRWEARYGRIPRRALVCLLSGWADRWSNMERYRNMDEKGVMHFPGFSPEAARFLVEERGVIGIGTDTLSLDPGISTDFAVHKIVLGANRHMLENLARLDRVPAAGAAVIIGVINVEDGTQSPARILALFE